jgi:hypothetical protein
MIISGIMDALSTEKKFTDALQWAETAKTKYPKSPFLGNITNRENGITVPTLSIKYETHTQPNLPIHFVAEHKNVNSFSLNIYEVKNDEANFLNYVYGWRENAFKNLKKTRIKKEEFTLQNLKDYKNYKTSMEVKSLSSGIYVAEYVVENSVRGNFHFIVTNSRIIFENKGKSPENTKIKLINRENGKPVSAENLELNQYDNYQ